MSDNTKKKFYIEKDLGVYLGAMTNNMPHKHYAFQISLCVQRPLTLINERGEELGKHGFFINSKVTHQLESQDPQLTILVNPLSPLGYCLFLKLGQTASMTLPDELSVPLAELLNRYENEALLFSDFIKSMREILDNFKGSDMPCKPFDQRINKALEYLDQNFERVVSLQEVASLCALSETRFLHLFKEKTNLNFRRFQLWNRLIKSIPYLQKMTITQAAHMFGFTDSAHYSRTFTETFGLSPKFLLQKE